MGILSNIKPQLVSEGYVAFENNSIIATPVVEGVWGVEEISVGKDYSNVSNFIFLADSLVRKLNSPSNLVGKGWEVLEVSPEGACIVSGIFGENNEKYNAYHIKMDSSGLVFKTYWFRKGKRLPWRKEDTGVVLSEHLDTLLDTLLEE